MERVAFLIERTGERIACLLNPESLEVRRSAGVRTRLGAGGVLTGQARSDNPLIATGGGVTDYELHLLFDTDIAQEGLPTPRDSTEPQAPRPSADVRELTRPLWNLAENAAGQDGFGAPPGVRFIWGKAWNVPGVVIDVAERLERFDTAGAPQRSWLSLRLRRVEESEAPGTRPVTPVTPQFEVPATLDPAAAEQFPAIDLLVDEAGIPQTRLDQICSNQYGDPGLAPALASYNGLDDLLSLAEGVTLVLPPLALLLGTAP